MSTPVLCRAIPSRGDRSAAGQVDESEGHAATNNGGEKVDDVVVDPGNSARPARS
jgi:hypothetical protein